ncbi:hypothetical protein ACWDFR_31460 [Streptomyces sp. 900105755]
MTLLESSQADHAASQFQQALVEVCATLVTHPEPFELVQPAEGALGHPPDLARAASVSDAASATIGLMPPFHCRRRYLSKS